MNQIMYAGCLFALAAACRPAPHASAAALQAAGKIPITTRSEEARALLLRGRALNENLQPHEAHALFRQAVTLDPSFAFAEYSLAATAPTAREIAEHLRKALALADSASLGERLLILAFQARSHGDPARARALADSLVALYPQDERAQWTRGNACSAQQEYACAIAAFRAAIAINPEYSLAYNQLGYAYRGADKMDEAEVAFKQYIALVPDDPNPYDSYGELLMKAGRFDESIAQYRKALSIDEHFTGSFVGIAANEMYAGRYDAAVAESERYFAVARDDRERRAALLTLAITHVDRGATSRAIRVLERRRAIARATADTVNIAADGVLIGDVLLEAGRILAAQEEFTRAHALLATSGAADDLKQDDALSARYDAAKVALAQGNLDLARVEAAAYEAGATSRRNDVRLRQAHELNGRVALAAKQFDQSLLAFAKADQQNPAVLHAMSRAHAGKGDSGKAAELALRAKQMNILPTFPYAFTRASLAAATPTATSGIARGMRR